MLLPGRASRAEFILSGRFVQTMNGSLMSDQLPAESRALTLIVYNADANHW
jgi:hypothetical protein